MDRSVAPDERTTPESAPESQTRGFLFADLRGYTAYTDRRGDDAARQLLSRYRRLVREELQRHGGAEIRTEGDSFYVVFGSVRQAVLAGLAIAEAATAASAEAPADPIRVGIGIHAGETVDDAAQGIVSSAVNVAARICAVAEPGEVLVTDTVRALTRTALPITFMPRGRRRLKGIAEPVGVYRAVRTADTPVQRRRVAAPVLGGVVLIALVAGVALRSGTPPTTEGVSSSVPPRSSGAEPSEQPEQTHDLSRFTDPGEFPNATERILLDRLPAEISDSCARADLADRPVFHFDPEEPDPAISLIRVRAGVSCLTSGVRVEYWQGPDAPRFELEAAAEILFNRAARLSLREGDCETESGVHGAWARGLHMGFVLCYVGADGSAVMHWSMDGPNIYGIASRRDGDTRALYEWWRDTGVRLGR